jgi:hypothetical protein
MVSSFLSGLSFGSAGSALILTAVIMLGTVLALAGYSARRAGRRGLVVILGGGLFVLVGALLASGLTWLADDGALRRSIDLRTAELNARALAQGSALACLDAVANADVEAACEGALFASPEQVATAVAYVDARISLLAAGAALAARDATFRPSFERVRRGLEADPYGLVAHVLKTRGCEPAGCAELKLLRDAAPIVANMKAQSFDSHVTAHASSWPANGGGPIANPQASAVPPANSGAGQATVASEPPGPPGGNPGRTFDFPSAASIPAVSIMSPEPSGPPVAAQPPTESRAAATPTPPKRPAQASRRQTTREAREPPQPLPAPMSVLPPPPGQGTTPQTSGQR